MSHKTSLKEDFIIQGSFPRDLDLTNYQKISSLVFESFTKQDRKTDKKYNYQYNLFFLYDEQNVLWLETNLREHFQVNYKKNLLCINKSFTYQQRGQSINSHYQVDHFNLNKSPDITAYYVLHNKDKDAHIMFEYETTKSLDNRTWRNLKENNFYIFPSDLRHSISENNSNIPLVILIFQFAITKIV
mgnify:CR=1 FL=1